MQEVVDVGRAGVAVTADGDALVIGAVCDEREEIVQLVRDASGLGGVAGGSRAVELRRENVVHHPSRVSDPKAPRLDTTTFASACFVTAPYTQAKSVSLVPR